MENFNFSLIKFYKNFPRQWPVRNFYFHYKKIIISVIENTTNIIRTKIFLKISDIII